MSPRRRPSCKTDRADTGGQVESQQIASMTSATSAISKRHRALAGATQGYRSNSPIFNSQESLQVPVKRLDRLNNFMIEGLITTLRRKQPHGGRASGRRYQQVIVSTNGTTIPIRAYWRRGHQRNMKSGHQRLPWEPVRVPQRQRYAGAKLFPYTAPKVPHAINNQYGGSAGGRITRQAFLLCRFSSTNNIVGQVATPTIPTAAMRTGNFSASSNTIYDPTTGNLIPE